MIVMKAKRQAKILELLKDKRFKNQEELIAELRNLGFAATQATISRDMKELGLIKTPIGNGEYKYASAPSKAPVVSEKTLNIFKSYVISVDYSFNMVVLKTQSGVAQAVCAAFDSGLRRGVLGTIAGDDTIFIVTDGEDTSLVLSAELKKLIPSERL